MELRNLRTFITICETGSFSKAAERLGYTQSTVTAQMKQLEEELGTELFDRSGKRFDISEKGRSLLPYANRLITTEQEARDVVSDTETVSGALRIGVIESVGTYVLPGILKTFMKQYPQVDIHVWTATTREIMTMLDQNRLDMILTLDEKVIKDNWACLFEKSDDIVFLCSREHKFANKKDISLGDVLEENIILTEPECNYRVTFERICNTSDHRITSNLDIGCTKTILDFTEDDLGITFLPQVTAANRLRAGTLSSFSVKGAHMSMLIQLIRRTDKYYSPAMKKFADVVSASF